MGATLCCGAWASHGSGFSCCRAQALGTQASVVVTRGLSSFQPSDSRALSPQLWLTGFIAPWHMASSQTRDRTRIGSRLLSTVPPGKSCAGCTGLLSWTGGCLQGECPHPFYIAIAEKEQFCGVFFFFFGHTTQHVGSLCSPQSRLLRRDSCENL